MNRRIPTLFLPLFLLFAVQCTSTKWTVTDPYAVDEREAPEITGSDYRVLPSGTVSVTRPFLNLDLYRIDEQVFPRRVLVERTIQSWRPRWGFTVLGTLGASFAFYAGNADGFAGGPAGERSLALQSAGVMLAALGFTHMRETGKPIRTGETKFLRRSGTLVLTDTTRVEELDETALRNLTRHPVEITIDHGEERLLSRSYDAFEEKQFAIRLTQLFGGETLTGPDPGRLDITLSQPGWQERLSRPVSSFMQPVVVVTEPVAELRSSPVFDDLPPVRDVAAGSELLFVRQHSERWLEVLLDGSNLFLPHDSGQIRWREEENIVTPTVIAVEDVPFGEISVEYSVPVLVRDNPSATALLIGNHRNNQIGSRRYADRDFRLMELYFRDALAVPSSSVLSASLTGGESVAGLLEQVRPAGSSVTYVWLSGFARSAGEDSPGTLQLVHLDEEGEIRTADLEQLLTGLAASAERLVVFLDLEFGHGLETGGGLSAAEGAGLLRELAGAVTQVNETSALIFGSRPDQSSGLYESLRLERKHHHIFPYFVAQGLQQRRTVLRDLTRFLENQVDYTSRRLHDRPQTILAFGNLEMNLAGR